MKSDFLLDSQVHLARLDGSAPSAELSQLSGETSRIMPDLVSQLLRRLCLEGGLRLESESESSWNLLGGLINPGESVLLKPNWVFHQNHSGQGMDCLVTHASVLRAVLDLVLRAQPGKVVVGDAPIQGCDLPKLMETAGYNTLKEHYAQAGAAVEWLDFRRTVLANPEGVWDRQTSLRPLEDYVLFDLGVESLLEPIARDAERFRVTMYNPDLMRQTHAPGRHQYLIARDVIEADVVINLPKLKTHKKACVTGALKNLVGINGNKDYLPHQIGRASCRERV